MHNGYSKRFSVTINAVFHGVIYKIELIPVVVDPVLSVFMGFFRTRKCVCIVPQNRIHRNWKNEADYVAYIVSLVCYVFIWKKNKLLFKHIAQLLLQIERKNLRLKMSVLYTIFEVITSFGFSIFYIGRLWCHDFWLFIIL